VELISGIPYVGVKSDIWAMGVVLFILAAGDPPFYGSSLSSLYARIKAVDYRCPDHFSKDLKRLLSKILVKDPKHRITMDDLRNDKWVIHEEAGPPERILPKLTGNSDVSQISQFIDGITKDKNSIVYSLHKHSDSRSPQAPGASVPIVSPMAKFTRKMSIRRASPTKEDESGDSDYVAPLGGLSLGIGGTGGRRKSNATVSGSPADSVSLRRRGSSASPSTARAMATANFPADRPTQVMRRMSSVGPAALPPPVVDSPKVGGARRASAIGNTIKDKSVVAASNGAKLVKSISQIVDDIDPFLDENEDDEDITVEELQDWHTFHRPASEIRTVRFSFSPRTTSPLAPAIIFRELHRVLLFTQEHVKSLKLKRSDEYYMVICSTEEYGEKPMQFEIEICSVWMLKLRGLRFKRISGDPFAYKKLYEQIVSELDIKQVE
jgi:serine/threonine protein kinase